MRALLLHCKQYGIKIGKMSNRPEDIAPEEVQEKEQNCKDCVVALITVEKNDDVEKSSAIISEEVSQMCQEVGHNNVVVLPFAHLSNNLAKSEDGIKIISSIENSLKKKFNVFRAHFGSHKELLLDIYGHPGNARYREI
jgi:threonyl-tRNA synthetase